MTVIEPLSERALVLTPLGRDSQLAQLMLKEAGFHGVITPIWRRCARNWSTAPGC